MEPFERKSWRRPLEQAHASLQTGPLDRWPSALKPGFAAPSRELESLGCELMKPSLVLVSFDARRESRCEVEEEGILEKMKRE